VHKYIVSYLQIQIVWTTFPYCEIQTCESMGPRACKRVFYEVSISWMENILEHYGKGLYASPLIVHEIVGSILS